MCNPLIEQLEEQGFDNCAPGENGSANVACSQCQALVINGVPTHEAGCPNQKHECRGCDAIVPKGVRYCEDCS